MCGILPATAIAWAATANAAAHITALIRTAIPAAIQLITPPIKVTPAVIPATSFFKISKIVHINKPFL